MGSKTCNPGNCDTVLVLLEARSTPVRLHFVPSGGRNSASQSQLQGGQSGPLQGCRGSDSRAVSCPQSAWRTLAHPLAPPHPILSGAACLLLLWRSHREEKVEFTFYLATSVHGRVAFFSLP